MNKKISAICIVKNEEENIKKSIDSYKDVVNEIIIVDTGSTDRTVEICRDMGCTLYYYDWDYNFAEARNFGISKAKYDYILFLDADEYFHKKLCVEDKETLISSIKEDEGVAFCTNNIDLESGELLFLDYNIKFFKNINSNRYCRCIHENLYHNGKPIKTVLNNKNKIVHTGYSKNINYKKLKRNLEILNKIYNKSTIDYFYLSRENFGLGNYKECIKNCDIFFNKEDYIDVINRNASTYMIYFYMINSLEELYSVDSFENRKEILHKMEQDFPKTPKLYYELGKLYQEVDFKKSYNYLIKSINLNNEYNTNYPYDYFYVNRYNEYEPHLYYLLSKSLVMMHDNKGAIDKAIVSCMLDNRNSIYLINLLNMISGKGDNYIIKLIYSIFKPKITSDYEFIVNSLLETKLINVLLYFIKEYNMKYNGGNMSVYIGMLLNNDYEVAINTSTNILSKKYQEESEYIIALSIIYSKSKRIMKKYIEYLGDEYKDIVRYCYGDNIVLSIVEKEKYMDIYIRMYLMKNSQWLPFNIVDFDEKDISRFLNKCITVMDYNEVIIESYKLMESQKSNNFKKEILKILIYSLHINKMYSIAKNKSDIYKDFMSEYVNNLLKIEKGEL